ncbi:MAG TPA: SRPBCC family protein [Rhizomicrobium sp.]|nr:SRPBCC family protein [Rhizomicrobium sp.]
MKSLVLVFAMLASPALAAPAIRDTSHVDPYGHRVQELVLTVKAPVRQVWDAFMTDAGFTSWAAPVAHVTLENGGGMVEATYSLDGKIGDPDNIRNEIVAYLPCRMVAYRNAHVPNGAPFDPVLIRTIRTIVMFEDIGKGRTRVTESQVGYGDGPGYDSLFRHFHDGNAEEFAALAARFARGPMDWKAQAAADEASVHKADTK